MNNEPRPRAFKCSGCGDVAKNTALNNGEEQINRHIGQMKRRDAPNHADAEPVPLYEENQLPATTVPSIGYSYNCPKCGTFNLLGAYAKMENETGTITCSNCGIDFDAEDGREVILREDADNRDAIYRGDTDG